MSNTEVFSPFRINDNEYIRYKGAYFIKIFHQTHNPNNLFKIDDELEALYTGSLGDEKYSRLSIISEVFKVHSKYEFIINWPDLDDNPYYHWRQTNNPTKEVETIDKSTADGFEPIHNHTYYSKWGGLVKSTNTPGYDIGSYLDGVTDPRKWHFAIAMNNRSEHYSNTGIPAYHDTNNNKEYTAQECDLWLRLPNSFPFFITKRLRFALNFNHIFPFITCFLK